MHHAHVCQAAGDSIRLSQALAGKGVIPLSPLLHAQVRTLPWRQVPAGSVTRDTGHGRAETRTLKATHVSRLDFPHARQAIKITRWRQDITAGGASREAVYAVTSLTSAEATAQDLARLVRDHWSVEAHHHVRSPGVPRAVA